MGLKFLWKLYVLFERITHGREREFTNVTQYPLLTLEHGIEAFKNIMVVMISTGTFDRVSEKSGQLPTMTWAFVATFLRHCARLGSTYLRTKKEEKKEEKKEDALSSKVTRRRSKVVVSSCLCNNFLVVVLCKADVKNYYVTELTPSFLKIVSLSESSHFFMLPGTFDHSQFLEEWKELHFLQSQSEQLQRASPREPRRSIR